MTLLRSPCNVGMVVFGAPFFGGAEKRYVNLFRHLSRADYPIRLLVNRSIYSRFLEMDLLSPDDRGITVVDLPGERKRMALPSSGGSAGSGTAGRPGTGKRLTGYIKAVIKYLYIWRLVAAWKRRHSLSVLHGIFQGVYALTPWFYRRKAATVVSYNDSSFGLLKSGYNPFFLCYGPGLQRATKVDFLSPFVADGVRRSGIVVLDERTCVSPGSFIDIDRFKPGIKEPKSVVFCGRFIPYKNPLLFVEALPEIFRVCPDARIYLIGKGELEEAIRHRLDELELADRIQIGFYENPEAILARTEIFVSLQETNNYPSQSLMEAMACGNAVVATDVGETRLLVREDNGILIDKTPGALAGAVTELLQDPGRCAEMGERGRSLIRGEHSTERFSAYMTSVYDRAWQEWHDGQ